jgi:hypothetical protein
MAEERGYGRDGSRPSRGSRGAERPAAEPPADRRSASKPIEIKLAAVPPPLLELKVESPVKWI